jgi:hypothetical protein
MYDNYPAFATRAILTRHLVSAKVHSLARINNERERGDRTTMNTLANIEAHLQYVTTKQLQDALHQEQLKLAQENHTGAMRTTLSRTRISIGTMLITFGERLQASQAARQTDIHSATKTRTA